MVPVQSSILMATKLYHNIFNSPLVSITLLCVSLRSQTVFLQPLQFVIFLSLDFSLYLHFFYYTFRLFCRLTFVVKPTPRAADARILQTINTCLIFPYKD